MRNSTPTARKDGISEMKQEGGSLKKIREIRRSIHEEEKDLDPHEARLRQRERVTAFLSKYGKKVGRHADVPK